MRYQQASELKSDVESFSSGDYLAGDLPDESRPRPKRRREYEYRSATTVFGWPLVHIRSARDPEGKKLRVACGIIAIGDVAIGGVAIGAFSFGGIAIGPFCVGLVSFGGVILGLLTALGGVAFGGFAVGGVAIGGIAVGSLAIGLTAKGVFPVGFFTLTAAGLARMHLLGWLIQSVGFTIGAVAAAYAWALAAKARPPRRS